MGDYNPLVGYPLVYEPLKGLKKITLRGILKSDAFYFVKVSKSRKQFMIFQFFQKTNETHYSEDLLVSKYAQNSELCG